MSNEAKSSQSSNSSNSRFNSPGFRCIFICASYALLFLSPDGSGFFTALAIICISLVHDYFCFNPKERLLKVVRKITFGIVIMSSAIAMAGVIGILEISKRYGLAYIAVPDNIFFISEIEVGLRFVLYFAALLPICALVDWFLSPASGQA